MSKDLDDFIAGLRPDVVVEGVGRNGRALSISEALALRNWFDARRKKIVSSGGRPTNPEWSIKRQIPMTETTWESLKRFASDLSNTGAAVSPAQFASLVLEAAIADLGKSDSSATSASSPDNDTEQLEDSTLPDRYRQWQMPQVFGVAA